VNASEAQLKAIAEPPRILHLATHGFFRATRRGSTERPLTLAGLALAGANRGLDGGQGPSGEDGILYALEAQDLALAGTELVTLSACETGRGALDSTEGIYGMVRSLQLAGARNVLMTLWPLDDALAAEFMLVIYGKDAAGRGEATWRALGLNRIELRERRRDRLGEAKTLVKVLAVAREQPANAELQQVAGEVRERLERLIGDDQEYALMFREAEVHTRSLWSKRWSSTGPAGY
jgi:hypothetical protein